MSYKLLKKALLLLEDGTVFYGKTVAKEGTCYGELCFNTGMTGYQEIFTDPSYLGQIMVMSSPHVGNYGILDKESESDKAKISGLVCRNFNYEYSRNNKDCYSLKDFLQKNNILAIQGVDTRALVSHIRDEGVMNAIISTEINNIKQLKKQLKEVPSMKGLELSSKVSTKKPYCLGNPNASYKVAVIDMGIKKSILNHLLARDIYLKIFPYDVSFEELEAWNSDGYFISNGPGDPSESEKTIKTVKKINEKKKPLFGVCLGHQIIALANGVPTYKMHSGHRGINHPVINCQTNKGEITSQNHGFVIDKEKTMQNNDNVKITHKHLNDHTIAGIEVIDKNCFSVQYHPEAGPGPNDATYLFDKYIEIIKINK